MGNVQCGSPTGDDPEVVFLAMNEENESKQGSFLKVQVADKLRSILEPREVDKALILQAEELLRRETLKQLSEQNTSRECYDIVGSTPDDVTDVFSGIENTLVDGHYSKYAQSDVAPSEITTGTTQTRVADNVDKKSSKKKPTVNRRYPQLADGQLSLMDVQDDLKSILLIENSPDRIAKQQRDARKTKFPRIYNLPEVENEATRGCGVLPLACIDDPQYEEAKLLQRFGENVSRNLHILHLRMQANCMDYFYREFSVLNPHDPLTQVVDSNIGVTGLSPSRNKSNILPPLSPTSSDSSISLDEIDFGVGPPSQPVRLLTTSSVFMDLAITGSLGLVDRRSSGPIITASSRRKLLKSPDHYILLINRRSGVPLAVCALRAGCTGPPIVRIYATKRRAYGQRPAATTKALGFTWIDSYPLYTWAEIVTVGRYPDKVRYSIFTATGSDGRFEETPTYQAIHVSSGSPEIKMFCRSEQGNHYSGCALLSLSREEDYFPNNSPEGLFFHLSVAKGVDPALMICFAAFVDEALEKTFRMQAEGVPESAFSLSRAGDHL